MALNRFGVHHYGADRIAHAPIVQAGDWIFGTGLRATDSNGVIDPDVVKAGRPLDPPPRPQREAEFIFRRLRQQLTDAGSGLSNVVRVDQYYPSWRAVDPYHVARKQAFGATVAPSTSILVNSLFNPDTQMDVQILAATSTSGLQVKGIPVSGMAAPKESGYSPCTTVGDLIFVAGQLARDESGNIAAEARVPAGQLWKGTRIKLETAYLVQRRLRPILQSVGSDLDCVLKAQVYLSRVDDFPAFWQVWSEAFGGKIPPTLVVPVNHPGFGTEDATVEINIIAAKSTARARIKNVECEVDLIGPDMIPARSFDGLLFVAGLMAIDSVGLVRKAGTGDTAQPGAEMADILDKAQRIFSAAGSDLQHVVRALQFHSDLAGFPKTYVEWRRLIGDVGLPFSALQVSERLFVPGASVIVDLWGFVPATR